ncbi:MAG TPA: hypothetical protein VEG27_12200 [Usitatibacter sp.]|nr:hypothetical protein [Usitatibacter sp.]
MRIPSAAFLALALLAAAVPAAAQHFPGHGGSSRSDEGGERSRDRPGKSAPIAADPFAALERELISLKVDIRLRADQVDAWNLFERDVRSVAEMDRAQRRHLMALRDSDGPPPTAASVVGGLADDARLKADTLADLRGHLEALYGKLDGEQRRMLDRRVVQSQTEPLGG